MNESFERMHEYLKDMGIKNNDFMLYTCNPRVLEYDPYDINIYGDNRKTTDIITECEVNIWYFFREILRIHIYGGYTAPFELDKANCAQIFLSSKNFSSYNNKPRQLGSRVTMASLALYCNLFRNGTIHCSIDCSNMVDQIVTVLPMYIQELYKGINRCKRKEADIIFIDNAEYDRNLQDMNVDKARWWHRQMRLKSLQTTGNAFVMFSSTISDYGNAYDLCNNNYKDCMCTIWNDQYYDIITSRSCINSLCSYFFYIKYSYKELGKDEYWFNDMCRCLANDENFIRREVLLERDNSHRTGYIEEENNDFYNFNEVIRKLIDGEKVTNNIWNGRYYLKIDNTGYIFKHTKTREREKYTPNIKELAKIIWYDYKEEN